MGKSQKPDGPDVPTSPSSAEIVRRALQRRWWLVLVVAGLAVTTAAVVTHTQSPSFRASASLVITPNPEIGNTDSLRSLDALDRRTIVATLAQIPSMRDMKKASAEELDWDVEKLQGYQIQASVVTGTNVVKIDVVGGDAEMVAQIAGTVARLTARDGQSMYPMYVLRPLVEPVPPEEPFLPDWKRNYFLSLMIGLFLGFMAALGAEYMQVFAASPPSAKAPHPAAQSLTKTNEES